MTRERLLSLFDEVVTEARETMASKNADYAEDGDALANFREAARDLEMSPERVWYAYFAKQVQAIKARVNGKTLKSESLRSRVVDCINFLVLLEGLSEDAQLSALRKALDTPLPAADADFPGPLRKSTPEDIGLRYHKYATQGCRAAVCDSPDKSQPGCSCGRRDPAT